jgi:hypothetical protein
MSWIDSRHWKISTGRHFQNGHHNTAKIQHCSISVEIFQCRQSIRDIIIYPHIKFWWYRTILNFCGIVGHILTRGSQDRSPFSKWPPQYRTNSTLSDFNDISYVGRLWCPELNPDIEQFILVAIFKMAGNQFRTSLSTHISNFDDIGQCWRSVLKHLSHRVQC